MLLVALFLLPLSLVTAEAAAEEPSNVIQLEAGVIHGTVHRARAFYVLNRARPEHESRELRQSRTAEIVRSVRRAPFTR